MRILFCGSGALAVPSLARLPQAGHELVGLVTQPARPAGRGGKLRPTPAAAAARSAGVEVVETATINAPEIVRWIADRRPDVICVADFGQMVRSAVRGTARLDTINLHASLLPALRGAAPINWAILRGLSRTGVSTFSLVDRLDAGPVYAREEIDIRPDETAEDLRGRCAALGAELLCRTLAMIEAGERPRPQDESGVTLAPQLQKADGLIDWGEPAAAVRNRIHGTWPWPGGQTVFRRQGGYEIPVILARAAAMDDASPAASGPAGAAPATRDVGLIDEDRYVVAGRGRVRILEIKPAGGRLMSWRDFVNGYRVSAGDRFARPAEADRHGGTKSTERR